MDKKWKVREKADDDFFVDYSDYNKIVLQLLFNRNIKTKEEIDIFLNGKYEDNFNPCLFRHMKLAVELVIKHLKNKDKICIFGDYDADGITSSSLLYDVFSIFKADVSVYIPDRVKDGYGMNKKAIDKIAEDGIKLIITVDTGIRNKEEIEYAKDKGVDVLLTDHHPAGDEADNLPDCLIINPNIKEEKYPFKKLAGVGVAFKLAQALINKSTLEDCHKILLTNRLLDLVAIGTVADMVGLVGENRILVKKGLETLNSTKRVGLKELIKVASLEGKELKEWNIGFQLAPRINASSRMASAASAFNLIIEKDIEKAKELAEELGEKNANRQKLTEEMVDEVIEQAEKQKDNKIIVGICPSSKCWKDGIVGLVAGRITERYYKPSLVITRNEDGLKGSGRSIPEFNLAEAIDSVGQYLGKHGGHPMACAFSLEEKNIDSFIKSINKIASEKLADVELIPKLEIDMEINIGEIDLELVNSVMQLAPFGKDNSEPIFLARNSIVKDILTMGVSGQHIKFKFNGLWAIAFGRAEKFSDVKLGDSVDIVFTLDINKFNGRETPQLKIIDMKLSK